MNPKGIYSSSSGPNDPVARSFGVKEKDMVLKFKGGM
jgi:hypothetical protein